MRDLLRQVCHATRDRFQFLILKPDLDCTFYNVNDLILVLMHVESVAAFGSELKFKKIVSAVRLLRCEFVSYPQEFDCFAFPCGIVEYPEVLFAKIEGSGRS